MGIWSTLARALRLGWPRWASSHTAQPTGTMATSASSSSFSAVEDSPATMALVAIGGGEYTDWDIDLAQLMGLTRGSMLYHLAVSRRFGPSVDKSADDFAVWLATSAVYDPPSLAWMPLLPTRTVKSVLGTAALRYVFVKVEHREQPTRVSDGGPLVLTEYIEKGKKQLAVPFTILNKAEFDRLIDAGNFVYVISIGNKQPVRGILRWEDALAAKDEDGMMLQLVTRATAGMAGDLSAVKAAIKNRATGLEHQTTHAIAKSPELLAKYGHLDALNNGRGVTFCHKLSKATAMEVDGVVVNTTHVLINECRSTLDPQHIMGSTDSQPGDAENEMSMAERAMLLGEIFSQPSNYFSIPADVLGVCAGKKVTLVASGYTITEVAELKCRELGIELFKPQGQGGTYEVAGVGPTATPA